jgi:myosin heavy chain 9/10/11/14
MEKQVKELHLKIVDLETKSLASVTPRSTISRRHDSRIDEITSQLKGSTSRPPPTGEIERLRVKMEEERNVHDAEIKSMRQTLDAMVRISVGHLSALLIRFYVAK